MKTKFKVGNKVTDESGRLLKITEVTENTYLYEVVGSSINGGVSIEKGNKSFKLVHSQTMMHINSEKTVIRNGNHTIVKIEPHYNLIEYGDTQDRISRKYYELCGETKGISTCAPSDTYTPETGEVLAEVRAWRQSKKNYLRYMKFMRDELKNLQEIIDNTIEKAEKDIEHNEAFIEKFKK